MTDKFDASRNDHMPCPRNCGEDVRDHKSSDVIDGGCDTGKTEVPLLDSGGYLSCGCHGSQRDHTCIPFN